MPLISTDDERRRREVEIPITGVRVPEVEPEWSRPPTSNGNERPSLVKAAGNLGKSIARDIGLMPHTRRETMDERAGICRSGACGRYVMKPGGSEYCGHRYFDVTLGRVKAEDVQGCGCGLKKKWNDPRAACPMPDPLWVAEGPTGPS